MYAQMHISIHMLVGFHSFHHFGSVSTLFSMAEANNILPHPSGMSLVMPLKAGPSCPSVVLWDQVPTSFPLSRLPLALYSQLIFPEILNQQEFVFPWLDADSSLPLRASSDLYFDIQESDCLCYIISLFFQFNSWASWGLVHTHTLSRFMYFMPSWRILCSRMVSISVLWFLSLVSKNTYLAHTMHAAHLIFVYIMFKSASS